MNGERAITQRVRHEAIVRRIAHRRVQDAIDEQSARCLVELVLHGLAAGRHFDDDVQILGRVLAGRDEVDTHGGPFDMTMPALLVWGAAGTTLD
jgi:hypothetical protein